MNLQYRNGEPLEEEQISSRYRIAELDVFLEGLCPAREPLRIDRGKLTGTVIEGLAKFRETTRMSHDASARSNWLEKRLPQIQRRCRTLVKTASDVVWTIDLGLRYTYVSPSITRILGYTVDEIMSQHPLDGLTPESRERVVKAYQEELALDAAGLKERHTARTLEIERYHKDGSTRWHEIRATFLRDEIGRPVEILGMSRDITDRKLTAETLRRTRDELEQRVEKDTAELQELKEMLDRETNERSNALQEMENLRAQLLHAQKMEALGVLAGGIAHDFNNMLQVIVGYSDMLLADKQEGHPEYSELQNILRAAKNSAELVKRILAYGRKQETKARPLKLNQQIIHVKTLLARTIPKMIDIELVLSDGLSTVNADPVQVEQVLMNLAVNAKDAMSGGGTLTIETRNVRLPEGCCTPNLEAKPGDYVLLAVSDTGHGMDQATQARMFEPFFTTKEIAEGTGLGLAVIHGIVKQYGGYVSCDSELGRGTTFRVYLPATRTEAELETPATAAVPQRGSETILLVDDEEFVRDFGNRVLSRVGYSVMTAVNGKDALEKYTREGTCISLVILDLIMPEMGGQQCLEELLRIDPTVKVLVASGLYSEGPLKAAIESGARGLLRKPYGVSTMLAAVRETLDVVAEESGASCMKSPELIPMSVHTCEMSGRGAGVS